MTDRRQHETAAERPSCAASVPCLRGPSGVFNSPQLPLNAELQRSGCVLRLFRSAKITWNIADKHNVARVVDHALDMVE